MQTTQDNAQANTLNPIAQGFQEENAPAPILSKSVPYDERLSSWEMSQLRLIIKLIVL